MIQWSLLLPSPTLSLLFLAKHTIFPHTTVALLASLQWSNLGLQGLIHGPQGTILPAALVQLVGNHYLDLTSVTNLRKFVHALLKMRSTVMIACAQFHQLGLFISTSSPK